jgi:hypothetical protein
MSTSADDLTGTDAAEEQPQRRPDWLATFEKLAAQHAAAQRQWDALSPAVKRRRTRRAVGTARAMILRTAGMPTAPPCSARSRQPRAAAPRRRGSRRGSGRATRAGPDGSDGSDPDGAPLARRVVRGRRRASGQVREELFKAHHYSLLATIGGSLRPAATPDGPRRADHEKGHSRWIVWTAAVP